MLRIAIQSKGRLFEDTMALLQEAGIKLSTSKRTLLVQAANFPLEVLFLRDDDIPQTVAGGVADLGIVGENEFVERQEDAECLIKSRTYLLENYLDELNESRYDENEYYSLEIFKIIGHEQLRVDGICNSSREQHDEYNGGTHSDCGVELLRHAEERADAEELCENEVLCKDTGKQY